MIERWADLLVEYLLESRTGETIALGARCSAGRWSRLALRQSSAAEDMRWCDSSSPDCTSCLSRGSIRSPTGILAAKSALFEAQSGQCAIRIAESDTRSMSRVDAGRQAIYERARDPIRRATAAGRTAGC